MIGCFLETVGQYGDSRIRMALERKGKGEDVGIPGQLITFGNLECRDGLPFIHGHEPSIFPLTTRKIDDQSLFVVVQGFQDGFESIQGEFAVGK